MNQLKENAAGFNFMSMDEAVDDKIEMENCDNDAFYFLILTLIIVVTFFLFKSEILHLIFSQMTSVS